MASNEELRSAASPRMWSNASCASSQLMGSESSHGSSRASGHGSKPDARSTQPGLQLVRSLAE